MEELWDEKDRQFVRSNERVGVSLLRQARQRVRDLPPAAVGQHPETPLSEAASEAAGVLLDHVAALPEDKQIEALVMVASGMIMEHLRLATTPPRGWQRS